MRQFVNTALIRRNDYVGRGMIIGGLLLVLGGFLYSFTEPDAFLELSLVLIVGIILSQAGLMIFARWGSKPRQHEILGSELRGFSDNHLLIHFALRARHFFLCTGGIFNLIPIHHDGSVITQEGVLTVTTPPRGLLRRGRTIRLARMQRAALKEADRLGHSIAEMIDTGKALPTQPVFVFTGDEVTIENASDDLLVVHLKQLKNTLRKACKSMNILTTDEIAIIIDRIA